MEDVLKIAAGVILAFLFMEFLTYLKNAEARNSQRKRREEFERNIERATGEALQAFFAHQEEEAKKKPAPRRKPATKKAPVKKPVTKKKGTK